MSTAILIIIFIVALIFSVGFLILVLTLVPAINQLRILFSDFEKTSVKSRDLIENLNELSEKVNTDIVKIDSLIDSSKATAETISSSLKLINNKVLKQSAGFLAMIPAVKFGWKFIKKYWR